MKTVVGMFDSMQDADRVVDSLRAEGLTNEQISVVARDTRDQANAVGSRHSEGRDPVETSGFALGGATVGGVLGLIAAATGAVGSLAIPGIGPVIAGGLLATAIGAGVGAAAGGIIGALTSHGVPEEDANVYAEGVRRGSTLVTAHVDDHMADRVENLMRQANVVDVSQRRTDWQSGGWNKFDPNAEPDNYNRNWHESSKAGTAAGTATGAATGAAIGAVGGPAGALIGAAAGAATGAGVGAAGDTIGEAADDDETRRRNAANKQTL
jgi:hypothetical protein